MAVWVNHDFQEGAKKEPPPDEHRGRGRGHNRTLVAVRRTLGQITSHIVG